MTSIVEIIKHYQKSIDRSLNDEGRLLHCIAKLYRLPVLVQHLQETGIGRTVNGLRKYDGEVGVAAKALVSKWKSMVAAEESEDGGEQQPNHHNHGQQPGDDDEDDEDNFDESRLQVDEQHLDEEDANDSGQEEMHEDESPRQQGRQEEYQRMEEEDSDDETKVVKLESKEHDRKSSSSKSSRDRHEKESTNHHTSSSSSSSKGHSSSKKSSSERDKRDKPGKSSSSSSERKSSSQTSGKESSHSSSREKSSSSKHHSSTKVSSKEGSNGYNKEESSSKRRRSEEVDQVSHTKKVKNEELSEKSGSERHKSSSSGKSSSSKDRSKKGSSEKKRESSSKKKSDSEEEIEGLDSSAGASFADALAMIGMPSSSKKKSSSDKPKKSSSSMPPPAVKSRSEKTSHSHSSSKSSRSKESSSPKSTASSSGYSSCSSSAPLLGRNVELVPLPEVSEIVESLPIISPNYKPMPLNQTVMGCVFGNNGKPQKSHISEEEALGHSMQSKNQRTKVYSGVKTFKGVVPSLFDLCIRMMQENIDLLEETGGVPFDLLKPVLVRASPEQLLNLENINPYLMEDSDILWEQHCKRQFRAQKRKEEECESWREMYIRCSEERDAKLRSLTQNIKLSQVEKAAPVRKTQLAYIDSAVKPPRNVISKQARYGTDRTPVVSPAARVAALQKASSNVTKVGDSRLRVAPGTRDTAQAQVFHPMKPKKAPMMTKVMASIKGIKGFRR